MQFFAFGSQDKSENYLFPAKSLRVAQTSSTLVCYIAEKNISAAGIEGSSNTDK